MINDDSERESQKKKSLRVKCGLVACPGARPGKEKRLPGVPCTCASVHGGQTPKTPFTPFLPCLVSDATGKNECFAFLLDFHPFEHNANKFNRALQSKFKSCYPQVSCLSYNMAAFLAPSVVVKSIDTTRVAFGCNLPLGMRTKGEISSGWRFSSKLALRVITAWAPTDRHPPHHLVDRRNLRLELRSKVAGGPCSIQIALHTMLFGEHPLDHWNAAAPEPSRPTCMSGFALASLKRCLCLKPLIGEEGMKLNPFRKVLSKCKWNKRYPQYETKCPTKDEMPGAFWQQWTNAALEIPLAILSASLPASAFILVCSATGQLPQTKAMPLLCECTEVSTLNSLALSASSFTLPYFALLCALPLSFPSFTRTPTSCSFASFSGLSKVWTELGVSGVESRG